MTNILSNIATPAGSTELTEVIAATLAQMTVGDISPVEAELRLTVIVYEEIRRARLEDYELLVRQLVEAGIIVSDSDQAKPADVPSIGFWGTEDPPNQSLAELLNR